MDRREFLEKAGAGAALALALTALHGCTNSLTPSGPVDFTIDLSTAAYSKLTTKGNYMIIQDCVVVYGTDGKYYAATVICTHEGEKQVAYISSTNSYKCSAHGAQFALSGSRLNSTGSSDLTTYTCDLSGTSLRVHS